MEELKGVLSADRTADAGTHTFHLTLADVQKKKRGLVINGSSRKKNVVIPDHNMGRSTLRDKEEKRT